MTSLEKLAIRVTTLALYILYVLFAAAPILLWYFLGSLWYLALYIVVLPILLIVAAVVQKIALAKMQAQKK